jgi:hypothetical protein
MRIGKTVDISNAVGIEIFGKAAKQRASNTLPAVALMNHHGTQHGCVVFNAIADTSNQSLIVQREKEEIVGA